MTDYIKREDALFIALQQPLYSVVSQIKQLEGVDIVRCKNCKWAKANGTYQWCGRLDSTARITADDYCSYGERREP